MEEQFERIETGRTPPYRWHVLWQVTGGKGCYGLLHDVRSLRDGIKGGFETEDEAVVHVLRSTKHRHAVAFVFDAKTGESQRIPMKVDRRGPHEHVV